MKRLLKVMRHTGNKLHSLPRVGLRAGVGGGQNAVQERLSSLGKHQKAPGKGL